MARPSRSSTFANYFPSPDFFATARIKHGGPVPREYVRGNGNSLLSRICWLVCISCYPSNVILGRYSLAFRGSRFVVSSFDEKFVYFRAISSSHKSRRRRRVHLQRADLRRTLFSPPSPLSAQKRNMNQENTSGGRIHGETWLIGSNFLRFLVLRFNRAIEIGLVCGFERTIQCLPFEISISHVIYIWYCNRRIFLEYL